MGSRLFSDQTNFEGFGSDVAMNADGSIIAAIAPGEDTPGNDAGAVMIYQYTENTCAASSCWKQLGDDIRGEAANDMTSSTGSVDLSDDGTFVIIGADTNDGFAEDAGHSRIFKYSNGDWVQVGQDIDGEAFKDRSGFDVAISGDGSKVAIGAICNDGDTGNNVDCRGHARIYEYVE